MHWFGRIITIFALLLTAACASQQTTDNRAQPGHAKQQMTKPANMPVEDEVNALISRSQMADEVLLQAMAQIGVPYRWGGSSPQTGFDCTALTSVPRMGQKDHSLGGLVENLCTIVAASVIHRDYLKPRLPSFPNDI